MTTDGDPAPPDVTALASFPARATRSVFYTICAPPIGSAPRTSAPGIRRPALYDVVARMDTPQGKITVPAGNFPAIRIAIRLFDHGKELTDTQLWVWIAGTRRTLPCWSKP